MFVVSGLLLAALIQAQPSPGPQPAAGSVAETGTLSARVESAEIRDRVEADGFTERRIRARIKIFDSTGVTQFGQVAYPYVADYVTVEFAEVTLEKPDGRKVTVSKPLVEDLNPYGTAGVGVVADLRLKRMTVPGVEPGDTLSYQVTSTAKPVFPGKIAGWTSFFPRSLAVSQSYELDLPAAAAVRVRVDPQLKAAWQDVPAPAGRNVRKLAVRADQGVADDEAGDGKDDSAQDGPVPDVEFSNFASWEEVGTWWRTLAAPAFVPSDAVRTEVARLMAGKSGNREKAVALTQFVASQVRYLNVAFGMGHLRPHQPDEVLTSRYGDCKDKVALLIAMGRAAGIEIRPALIHSSRKDLLDDVPSTGQFDHVIAAVVLGPAPADWLWVDPTIDVAPAGFLPWQWRDKRVLMAADSLVSVVRTPMELPYPSFVETATEATLSAAGTIKATVKTTLRADEEPMLRVALRVSPREKWSEIAKSLGPEWGSSAKRSAVQVSDTLAVATPLSFQYAVDVAYADTREGDGAAWSKPWKFYPPAAAITLPDVARKPKDGVAVEWHDALQTSVCFEILLPAGLGGEAPLSVNLDRPFASYSSKYEIKDGRLRLERSLTIKQRKIPVAEQGAYEAFQRAVVADGKQTFAIAASALALGAEASADDLVALGKARWNDKDNAAAEKLFRAATVRDPAHEAAWYELALALRGLNRYQDGLAALDKAIALAPYHEYAYAERAYQLFELGRDDEAEQALLKQIEVAPFEDWSYGRLASRRESQDRYADAAALYKQQATLDAKDVGAWLGLARNAAWAGDKAPASDACARALELSGTPWTALDVGKVYTTLEDWSGATASLEKASATFEKWLAGATPDEMFEDGVAWVRALGTTWHFLGTNAMKRHELAQARTFLEAAWNLTFHHWYGGAIAILDETEKQSAAALAMLAELAALGKNGDDARRQLAKKVPDASARESLLATGQKALYDQRTLTIAKTGGAAKATYRLVMLVNRQGVVETTLSGRDSAQLPPDVARQVADTRVPFAGLPTTTKIVRSGWLNCGEPQGCTLILDILD